MIVFQLIAEVDDDIDDDEVEAEEGFDVVDRLSKFQLLFILFSWCLSLK